EQLVEPACLGGELGARRRPGADPAVAEPYRSAERRRGTAAEPDRERILHRLRLERLLAPEAPPRRPGLLGPTRALLWPQAARGPGEAGGPDADPDDQAPVAEAVEAREGACEADRLIGRQDEHRHAEPDRARRGRGDSQGHDRVERGVRPELRLH